MKLIFQILLVVFAVSCFFCMPGCQCFDDKQDRSETVTEWVGRPRPGFDK
ncbi:MAG: hypothetical protein Q4C96_07235 [Planctomycetia bacterium]|nr:hypothetical protein [Planctomycetia bacterium]